MLKTGVCSVTFRKFDVAEVIRLTAAAGLDGIEKKMTPPPEIVENIYEMDKATRAAHHIDSLPGSLDEALKEMEKDPLILDVLGEHVATNYIEGKRKEWEEYRIRVSSWETEKYLTVY